VDGSIRVTVREQDAKIRIEKAESSKMRFINRVWGFINKIKNLAGLATGF
jgi:hypothetical protein